MRTTIYIALGTNLGNRLQNFHKAVHLLQQNAIAVTAKSRVYETSPMYATHQPRFLNMVVQATTDISVTNLLATLKSIEKQVGRTKTYINGPRVVDLDILYYGTLVLDTAHLHIPHRRIHERQFVLQPMLDIAPDYIDRRTCKTIRQMANALPHDTNISVYTTKL